MSNKWTGSFELLSIERMKIVSQLIFEHFLSHVLIQNHGICLYLYILIIVEIFKKYRNNINCKVQ